MVTTCLIGFDPSVSVRPFWSDGDFSTRFVAQLGAWGDLGEVKLNPGESVIAVSRHHVDGEIYTWIAFYRAAGAFDSGRRETYMGAGFFLTGDETVPGETALNYLVDVVQDFLRLYAPDGALTCKVEDVSQAELQEPPSGAALRRAIRNRSEGSGLSARSKKGAGGVLFFDLSGPGESGAIPDYIDECQRNPRFEDYHTLLIGDAPDPEERRTVKDLVIVSGRDFLDQEPPARPEPPEPEAPAPRAKPDYWANMEDRPVRPRASPLVHIYEQRPHPPRQPNPPRPQRPPRPSTYRDGVMHGVIGTAIVLLAPAMLILAYGGLVGRTDQASGEGLVTTETDSRPRDGGETFRPPGDDESSGDGDIQTVDDATARAASAKVASYFDLLARRRISAALAMWAPEVKPAVGAGQLARAMNGYGRYQAIIEAGAATTRTGTDLTAEVPIKIAATLAAVPFESVGSVILRKGRTGEPPWLILSIRLSDDRADPLQQAAGK